jgi:predicted RNase H-like HicB family nuclease/DNA-binding XRE family transcriptional regulator
MIKYQAKIFQDGQAYSVIFPDLPGCYSTGLTRSEAAANAKQALSLYLEDIHDNREDIPRAANRRGKQYIWIIPEPDVAIPLTIRKARKLRGLSQSEFARRLKMTVQQVQKLETPGKSNPTVKTLINISEALEGSIDIQLVA